MLLDYRIQKYSFVSSLHFLTRDNYYALLKRTYDTFLILTKKALSLQELVLNSNLGNTIKRLGTAIENYCSIEKCTKYMKQKVVLFLDCSAAAPLVDVASFSNSKHLLNSVTL